MGRDMSSIRGESTTVPYTRDHLARNECKVVHSQGSFNLTRQTGDQCVHVAAWAVRRESPTDGAA